VKKFIENSGLCAACFLVFVAIVLGRLLAPIVFWCSMLPLSWLITACLFLIDRGDGKSPPRLGNPLIGIPLIGSMMFASLFICHLLVLFFQSQLPLFFQNLFS
jgi:hypothetical protein